MRFSKNGVAKMTKPRNQQFIPFTITPSILNGNG